MPSPRLRRFLAALTAMLLVLPDYAKVRCPRVAWRALDAVAAGMLYLVNPLGLVPDAIPGLGRLDHAPALALVRKAVCSGLEA